MEIKYLKTRKEDKKLDDDNLKDYNKEDRTLYEITQNKQMISRLIVLVILFVVNAFFAAAEIAFISLNDAKIEKQVKEGNKKAKQIRKMFKKSK